MATRPANQHQPVRVIRSTGSTRLDRPAPARRQATRPRTPAQGTRVCSNRQSASRSGRLRRRQRSAGRNDRPCSATTQTIPSRAGVAWCLAGPSTGWPTGSVAAKPPDRGIRTGSSARVFRDGLTVRRGSNDHAKRTHQPTDRRIFCAAATGRRLRSAISVCPPLQLRGSLASRLGGWAARAGNGRPQRAIGTRTHDPRHTLSRLLLSGW